MSTENKVELVKEAREPFGLAPALAALSLPRSTWHYWTKIRRPYKEKYADLKGPLQTVARQHPEYGYRRTKTELEEVHDVVVGEQVIRKLHRLLDLVLVRSVRPPKMSAIRQAIAEIGEKCNLVAGLDEIGPFEALYTDFTELVYATGKGFLIPLLDHRTKLVLGYAVGAAANTELALAAWIQAVDGLAEWDRTPKGIIVHHDRDPVFTSHDWLAQLLQRDGARVSYALRGAKDNPEMEAFNSRFKNENRSLLLEAQSLEDLQHVVAARMDYYNQVRRHSSLGNRSPWEYAEALGRKR